jgi:polyhydroxyalkanoate synthase subunit PhaC
MTAPHADQHPDEVAAGLDMLLADAELGPLRRMLPPPGSAVHLAAALARRPAIVTARGRALLGELGKIVLGQSSVSPGKADKRFKDPAWLGNPLLRRAMQAHLAASQTAQHLVTDADLDWRDLERMRLTTTNIADALAPSNNPLLNPLGWKALIDTGGRSAVRGVRHLVSDLSAPPRVPAMIDPDAFVVGEDLAVSPGEVVFRTPVFELIQYQPQTPTVRCVPLLMIPPTINKYYIADLAPGRSIVEYLVASGQQVFMMSWRNPGAEAANWGLDTYGQAVLDAMDAVERITSTDRSALMAFCSGGIVTAMVLARLAATGHADRVVAAALAVTVLDQAEAGTTSALLDRRTAKRAIAKSARKGYLDGAILAEVFAWLRPNDLVWNYWVNNYLAGKSPPPFDILYWNADTTRMPAELHHDFIEMALTNALVEPGAAVLLGTPIDLSAVGMDTYVIAGIADHLCKWQACYQTTQLLGGRSRFVLSTSGHIASLINPPGNPKATWRSATDTPSDPEEWLRQAKTEPGSWWPDFVAWLEKRCGDEVAAPEALGGGAPTLTPAPGTYVFDK